MGVRINTNMMSINAQRNLRGSKSRMDSSSEKLSSGHRINKSADDAAGLAISENLNGHIRSYGQAQRNAEDGISFIQVAEGGMNEISNMISRIRELGVQAASDTIGPAERTYLNREVQQLKLEMERLSQGTEYNGMKLLNGEGDKLDFQIGIRNDEFLDRISYDPSTTNVTLDALGLSGVEVETKAGAQDSLSKLDASIGALNSNRAQLGALQNRLNVTVSATAIAIENFSAAKSRIRDADFAAVTAEWAQSSMLQQAGLAVLSQANQAPNMALKLLG
ncbi:MAG TPA: flagellin [Bdellovibrionota bacterium]|nr:flagellin [Bdellovibrionota bacterium]